jgi:hypothetical protein
MRVQFKFRQEVSEDQRAEIISSLGEHGAERVRRLFPGEPDEELSTLYTLEAADQASAQRLVDVLNSSSAVEFAEIEAPRKLIW